MSDNKKKIFDKKLGVVFSVNQELLKDLTHELDVVDLLTSVAVKSTIAELSKVKRYMVGTGRVTLEFDTLPKGKLKRKIKGKGWK